MKNWLLAEFGFDVRAMEQTPRTCGSAENSAFRSGFSDPPMPVPVGSPPCAMKPSITRGNKTPRSEERRVGKEGVGTRRNRWSPENKKKQQRRRSKTNAQRFK